MNNFDDEYYNLIKDILDNEEFNKLKEIKHHGSTRFDHSMKVSYNSYLYAKKNNLNYIECARAGLLHDFFLSNKERSWGERFISTFTHPKKALNTSKKYFTLSKNEENIIEAHMFPIYPKLPTSKESYLVSITDKIVATKEVTYFFKTKLKYAYNALLLFLLIK